MSAYVERRFESLSADCIVTEANDKGTKKIGYI